MRRGGGGGAERGGGGGAERGEGICIHKIYGQPVYVRGVSTYFIKYLCSGRS